MEMGVWQGCSEEDWMVGLCRDRWMALDRPGGGHCPLSPTAFLTHVSARRFWFRLYWFPLKVLYATCHTSLLSVPDIPFYFFFNVLLLLLTVMNLYWFLVSPLTHSAGGPIPVPVAR